MPTVIYSTKHATLASTVSVGIFIMLETTKWFTKGIPFIDDIWNYESRYLDEREKRDGQGVILSHLFLLLGCTIPIMTMYTLNDWDPENQNRWVYLSLSGLFFVGLGDSTAALVGRDMGETRWFFGSHKTVEGSLACIITVLSCYFLAIVSFKIIPKPVTLAVELMMATFCTTVFEALTNQFDNY